MKNIVKFEVYGLYFVLSRSLLDGQEGIRFKLSDEAFSSRPISISADSFDKLFSEIEHHIALTLSDHDRDFIRLGLGGFRKQVGNTAGASMLFGPKHAKVLPALSC